jgi:hypothetical protein
MNLQGCLGAMFAVAAVGAGMSGQSVPLVMKRVIPLSGVEGRIDHLAFDAARDRLFVAALGNNSVEVIDTARDVHLKTLPGFHEPQGIAVVPDLGVVAVANGDSGTLQLIDRDTYQTKHIISIGGDADNVRYDAAARQLYVAYEGGLAVVDPGSGQVVRRMSIPGHPESFQLERNGPRIFVNLPGAGQIVVADRAATAVIARWPAVSPRANFPMALDEVTNRVFVGFRTPATLVVYDTMNGKNLASTSVAGDTDDLFYDSARRRVYVIGGEGFIDVLQRDAGDGLRRRLRIETASGARTGLFVPEQNRLYVAVPHRGAQRAELRIYEPQN